MISDTLTQDEWYPELVVESGVNACSEWSERLDQREYSVCACTWCLSKSVQRYDAIVHVRMCTYIYMSHAW